MLAAGVQRTLHPRVSYGNIPRDGVFVNKPSVVHDALPHEYQQHQLLRRGNCGPSGLLSSGEEDKVG